MAIGYRFGRRLRVPSSVEIDNDLRAMVRLEEGREKHARANGLAPGASWEEIGLHLAQAEQRKAKSAM